MIPCSPNRIEHSCNQWHWIRVEFQPGWWMEGKALSSWHTNTETDGGITWYLGRWIHLKVHTDLRLQVEGRDIVNSTIYVAASNAYSMKWTMILDGNSCRSLSWRKIPYFYWWPLSSQDFCKAIILRIRTGEIWLRATGRTKTYILKQQGKWGKR